MSSAHICWHRDHSFSSTAASKSDRANEVASTRHRHLIRCGASRTSECAVYRPAVRILELVQCPHMLRTAYSAATFCNGHVQAARLSQKGPSSASRGRCRRLRCKAEESDDDDDITPTADDNDDRDSTSGNSTVNEQEETGSTPGEEQESALIAAISKQEETGSFPWEQQESVLITTISKQEENVSSPGEQQESALIPTISKQEENIRSPGEQQESALIATVSKQEENVSSPGEQQESALIAIVGKQEGAAQLVGEDGSWDDDEDDDDDGMDEGAEEEEEGDEDDLPWWEEKRRAGSAQIDLEEEDIEKVFLIGVMLKRDKRTNAFTVDESLEELGRLADTAGLKVVGSSYQVLDAPNPTTYIGSGKVQEIAAAVSNLGVDTVIFDDELSPVQLRNLGKGFGRDNAVRVCDRTALILDIFSQRAQTKEGKLQVELAATEYQLPRVTRLWTHLERQSGGGQVKGMGEKQKEVDRRLLKNRMADLKKELEEVRRHRAQYRNRRNATPVPVAAMVGYTNAGKSTLLNTMTGAGVLAEDKLFATLDPTTRRIRMKGNQEVLLSDTVGFIQKLPTALVAAFRATLEEVEAATVLLHVLDVAHPNATGQAAAVMQVLHDMKATDIPIITVWNKIDQHPSPEELREQAAIMVRTVCVSGLTGEGLEELQDMIAACLEESMIEMDLMLPYASGELLDSIHKMGQVKSCEYTPHGTLINACVPKALAGRLEEFSILPPVEEPDVEPWLKKAEEPAPVIER